MTFGWNGERWAEQLEGEEKRAYEDLVRRLYEATTPKQIRKLALELFEMGHKHGYDLASNLYGYDD